MPSQTSPTSDTAVRDRALAAFAKAYDDLKALVNTADHTEPVNPGMDITTARTITVFAKNYKFMTVIAARVLHGASWAEVAELAGLRDEDAARVVYESVVARWLAGDDHPWQPTTQR